MDRCNAGFRQFPAIDPTGPKLLEAERSLSFVGWWMNRVETGMNGVILFLYSPHQAI